MLISPASKEFDAYYADLATYAGQGIIHEQATRFAFSKLLDTFAKPAGWTVVLEQKLDTSRKRPDATLYDAYKIPRGYWEAKDTQDDLDSEIQSKIKLKYPLTNTIFEDTRRAVLYQNGQVALELDLRQPEQLAALLTRYFSHTDEQIEQFHKAVEKFREDIPTLAAGLKSLFSSLHLRPRRQTPAGQHHGLGAGAVSGEVRAGRHQARHLSLRLRPPASPGIPGAVQGKPQARTAPDTAGGTYPRRKRRPLPKKEG